MKVNKSAVGGGGQSGSAAAVAAVLLLLILGVQGRKVRCDCISFDRLHAALMGEQGLQVWGLLVLTARRRSSRRVVVAFEKELVP